MTGLNDNFLLADDAMEPKDAPAVVINAFKEQTNEDGEPELRDDIDLIAAATEDLVVQMRDLNLLQQNIKEQGGMCQSIALEAHALLPDFINDERPVEFFTKHPSRTQLSAALEDINSGKKNIVLRMIEAIVAFIKRIAKKIKDFFIVSEEQKQAWKEQQEFAKNYKGPKGEKKDASDKADAGTDTQDDAGDAGDSGRQQRDKWDEKLALVAAMLGKDRLPIIAGLLSHDSNLYDNFKKTLEAAAKVMQDMTFDNHDFVGAELHTLVQECSKDIAEATGWSDVHLRDVLNTWVKYTNSPAADRVIALFDDNNHNSAHKLAGEISDYLNHLEHDVEELKKHPDDDEAVKKLKATQKFVSELAGFVALTTRISSAYHTTIKGLMK